MNATEQTKHTKVTDALDARVSNVETVLETLDERVSQAVVLFQRSIGEERTHRLKLAEQQRTYIDQGDKANDRVLDAWKQRGVRGRFRWLFRGV